MSEIKKDRSTLKEIKLRRYVWVLSTFWTLVITGAVIMGVRTQQHSTLELIRDHARGLVARDIIYRRWSAAHGGLYAPVTDTTAPNPYLDVKDRDITTPSGRNLTLINPAYMTRQVHGLASVDTGTRSHITSLNPIRPQNKADNWESLALERFNRGEVEVNSVETLNGKYILRLMRPLMTEKGCLKCHAKQGHKEGDIRGGISVAIPLAGEWPIKWSCFLRIALLHGLLWSLGLAVIFWAFHNLRTAFLVQSKAFDSLRDRDKRLRILFETSPDAIMTLEPPTWSFTSGNPAAVTMFKANDEADFASYPPWELSPEYQPNGCLSSEKAKNMIELALQRDLHYFEWTHTRTDGEDFPATVFLTRMEFDGRAFLQATVRDITEQKKAEEEKQLLDAELLKRQKLVAIGTLASGAAHEINNPVNGIMNYAQLIKDQSDPDSETAEFAGEIIKETERVASVTRGLQSYTSKESYASNKTHIDDMLMMAIRPLRDSLKKDDIAIEMKVPNNLPAISCQTKRVQNMIGNILRNAQEALNERYPKDNTDKVIRISVEKLHSDDNEKIRITFEDHGSGMTPAVLERVFEPFFTTKDRTAGAGAVGRGLGLATALNIALDNAGSLEADCKEGAYTRFHLILPLTDEDKNSPENA